MSEHMFGITYKKHSKKTVDQVRRIALEYGAYVAHHGGGIPGNEVWGWLAMSDSGVAKNISPKVMEKIGASGIDW